MMIPLCKASLVAVIGVFFAVVAFGNVTDYATNWGFVRHVLAMDTIFPDSTLKWRAITDPRIAALGYRLIIAWEALTAAILLYAAARMAAAARDPTHFVATKPIAVLGLTFGLLLYGLGFMVVGGEWFAMWQSQAWNGVPSAARFIMMIGLTLLIVLAPERHDDAGQTGRPSAVR
jgi:predicted small integral membrane protein